MKSLVCPFLALCVVVARAAIIPDCSGVDKNAAVKCTGSVLEGEGHCGEDVCAQVAKLFKLLINFYDVHLHS